MKIQRIWTQFSVRIAKADSMVSIEIVARRDLDAMTVQLGVQLQDAGNPQHPGKIIVTLMFRDGEWRVQSST
jgi:hypothetical protein